MPERVNPSGPVISAAVFVSLAMTAVNVASPVQAEGSCIEHPPQPAAESPRRSIHYDHAACHSCHAAPTEVLLWSVRYDRAKGRKCWFLVDAFGRDVTDAHVRETAAPTPTQTQAQTLSSKLASLFGNFNFTGASADVTPESGAPPGSPREPPRVRQGNTANASREDNGVRGGQRNNSEAQAAKRVSQVLSHPDERALYEEFLRWRRYQEIIKTLEPSPSVRH